MSDIEQNINKDKLILGVLSGTSVDSVDIVLVNINGSGKNTRIKVMDYKQYEIENEIKNLILDSSDISKSNAEIICKMNFFTGQYFASKINEFLKEKCLDAGDIYCIGSHGQTIYHYPKNEYLMNLPLKSSLQIGDISVIANLTGITTVGDFRCADIAAGGSGAPLVPYLDYIMYPYDDTTRLVLNIGGISNFTYLDVYCEPSEVIAFDAGPGNMLIDGMMRKLYNKEFDDCGKTALSGEVQHSILQKLIFADPYIHLEPPKSTGREDYGEKFLSLLNDYVDKYSKEDIIASVSEYTTYCIYYSFDKYINKTVDELIISGGGAKNEFITERLKILFPKSSVKLMDHNGITVDNKEAVLFAVLANETMNRKASNIPRATGASGSVIQGKVAYV